MLEACEPLVPLDLHSEQHMPSDRAGILVRRKLAALLGRATHGERIEIGAGGSPCAAPTRRGG